MKKVIVLIIMLATAVCSFAQVGWRTEVHHADELKGTEEYTAYIYTDSKGDYIVLWSNTDEDFRIVSNRHIFNYNSGGTKWFSSTVGLYDENGKLIEKVGIDFDAHNDDPRIAENSTTFRRDKKAAKKIITFIRNEKGYVRIIAPLYRSNNDYDIEIPCFKSEPKKKEKDGDDLSVIFRKGLDQLQQIKVIGIRDSASMSSYLTYIKQWGNDNSLKYGITVDDTASSDSVVLMHVEKRIYPNLVSAKNLDIPIYLLYDIEVAIDSLPFNGNIHVNDIRIQWEYEHNYAQTHAAQLLNLPSQQLKDLPEEVRALTNSILASGIGAKEKSAFRLNEAWLKIVQEAEDNQLPQAKIYLELFIATTLNTTWIVTDFPHFTK